MAAGAEMMGGVGGGVGGVLVVRGAANEGHGKFQRPIYLWMSECLQLPVIVCNCLNV